MLRIALVAHHVAPIRPPFAGGVESLTWYLARWLARRGHRVVLHAPPGSAVPGVEVRELELSPRLSETARADVSMPPDAFMDAHHAYQQLMLELAQARDVDVVHSHSLHYLPVALAPLLRTPVLLTLHTPPTPWLESALRARGRVGTTPRLSAVSPATRDLWAPVVDVPDVVVNGIDLEAWPAGPGGADAVWCGRIVPEKAPHLAIAAARLAGMRLTLAGPLIDRDYFAAQVAPLLGGDDVTYAGHLDHDGLAALVGRSRVALMTPAWDEPFGLAAAEAIACGTPVAGFARGGLPELVGDAGCLVPGSDPRALADALRTAALLPRAQVRAHAERALGLDAMGRGYEALYERMVRPHTSPSRRFLRVRAGQPAPALAPGTLQPDAV